MTIRPQSDIQLYNPALPYRSIAPTGPPGAIVSIYRTARETTGSASKHRKTFAEFSGYQRLTITQVGGAGCLLPSAQLEEAAAERSAALLGAKAPLTRSGRRRGRGSRFGVDLRREKRGSGAIEPLGVRGGQRPTTRPVVNVSTSAALTGSPLLVVAELLGCGESEELK